MDAPKNAALNAAWKKFQARIVAVQNKLNQQGRHVEKRASAEKIASLKKRLQDL
ncbi:MAG: hypothetical protein WC641_05920 [Patescibacteria group bacterium]